MEIKVIWLSVPAKNPIPFPPQWFPLFWCNERGPELGDKGDSTRWQFRIRMSWWSVTQQRCFSVADYSRVSENNIVIFLSRWKPPPLWTFFWSSVCVTFQVWVWDNSDNLSRFKTMLLPNWTIYPLLWPWMDIPTWWHNLMSLNN